MTIDLPDAIRRLYLRFDQEALDKLDDIYADNIHFRDPVHTVNGIDEMRQYFGAITTGLAECGFEFHQISRLHDDSEAVLFWTMHYRHPKLAGGKPLSLPGTSHIRFAEKVFYHRDYYDMGAMVYEQVPLLGGVIRHIKHRLVNK